MTTEKKLIDDEKEAGHVNTVFIWILWNILNIFCTTHIVRKIAFQGKAAEESIPKWFPSFLALSFRLRYTRINTMSVIGLSVGKFLIH